jgi:Holliday junction resolvase RusA-like endonuclease
MIRIEINPISVNSCWQGKRFKTPKYKKYESDVLIQLPNISICKAPYLIFINVGFSSKLSDLDNILKPIFDILQKKYNINDRDIYKINFLVSNIICNIAN